MTFLMSPALLQLISSIAPHHFTNLSADEFLVADNRAIDT